MLLDEKIADLCTFNTSFGRYQFICMSFDIASVPEIFKKSNLNLFDDMENGEIYFYDVIIAERNEDKYVITLEQVLDRAKNSNVKFNQDKFKFKVHEVEDVGQII